MKNNIKNNNADYKINSKDEVNKWMNVINNEIEDELSLVSEDKWTFPR